MIKTYKESFYYEANFDCDILARFDCEFSVYKSDHDLTYPIAPNNISDRIFKYRLKRGECLFIEFEGNCGFDDMPINLSEKGGGAKLVEIIPDEELSMYDRLKNELVAMMSQVSAQRGDESFEEANDLELEEDDDTPLTPYEYEEMKSEYLNEEVPPESAEPINQQNQESLPGDAEPDTPDAIAS